MDIVPKVLIAVINNGLTTAISVFTAPVPILPTSDIVTFLNLKSKSSTLSLNFPSSIVAKAFNVIGSVFKSNT